MRTMLAVRAHRGSGTPVLENIPVPEPGPRDVVVEVAAAGLAPGMMRLLEMGAFKHLPTTLGHEAAGVVAAIGDEVTDVAVGDRVRVHPNLNCRDCVHCHSDRDMMCAQQAMLGHAAFGDLPTPLYDAYHDGGLAEYVRVPHWLIDPLPEVVGFDVAAKVHDLANALRALKCADLPPGATVVVTAATGTMGTATIKLAPHFGVARLVLVGRDRERLDSAARLAGDVATDVVAFGDLPREWETTSGLTPRIRDAASGGAHAVIDFIPAGAATAQAMAALATGGTLVHMGSNATPLPLPPAAMMVNCWRFVGTRACTRTDAREILRMLAAGTLTADDLITHRFPLTEAVKAVDLMQRRTEPMWMTVVNP
ncbi:alcohol dehydrogenase catalytic domain-containing protein [Amycolatopsis regifaucium]|uniref:Theronine dehydrogenase n=1 Tax=Amycolatopsis regifaucium TaxID=546365 RepID=A0A154MF23_9PSEU|nr:alcohol dehydrogenase catalytic domain-containing protein [Amycolatopsis regifaucium]KZB83036.1 theronine dehydrogenase [Amycolatopsis regifaucium]OKA03434.1 theronine dehydrogenase [Amycolatopsis regifaucium]SFJ70522.1 alcohol dehydrogenase [Amycolatopsis regifaucium]